MPDRSSESVNHLLSEVSKNIPEKLHRCYTLAARMAIGVKVAWPEDYTRARLKGMTPEQATAHLLPFYNNRSRDIEHSEFDAAWYLQVILDWHRNPESAPPLITIEEYEQIENNLDHAGCAAEALTKLIMAEFKENSLNTVRGPSEYHAADIHKGVAGSARLEALVARWEGAL